MDADTRRRICRLIAGIVVVDDDLDDAESTFVNGMLTHFGLSPEDREHLFPIVDAGEAATELSQLPPELQQQALSMLIEAAAADRRFVAEEQAYLHRVGAVVGLGPEELDRRVAEALAKPRS